MSVGDYSEASGPRAGFWRRGCAFALDLVLVGVLLILLAAVINRAGSALGLLIGIGYFIYFEGGPTGQTPGKRMLGIRVVDFETGGPIGYGRAVLRDLGRIVSGSVLDIGYLWMLWDREKQTWHDKFAGSVVVPVAAYPIGTSTGTYTSTGAGF